MQEKDATRETINGANKSPLNTSKAKAMYTFPKEARFFHLNQQNSCKFYQKQTMLSKRAPSFGYGNKVDIAQKILSPSPDKYIIPSIFAKNMQLGVTIGHGREECKSISIFRQSEGPGPGSYNLYNEKQNIKALTMSGKTKFPSLWASSIAPGPAAYHVENIDTNGLCMTSKYNTKNGCTFHQKSPSKENKGNSSLIGPGTYQTNLSSTGKQVLARNNTQKTFYFNKQARQTIHQFTLSPGPGAYRHFSTFGII